MKIGVIDIGTNSVHMLLAEILPNYTFEVIGREKEMIRLGDGTLNSGRLSTDKMRLGLETLKKFKFLAQSKGVQRLEAVATSAIREAKNGGRFIERVRRETGIDVHVITGEEEGRLIYLGVKHSVPLPDTPTLIVDIGGGSVELMVVNREEILFLTSVKLGAARLHGQFLNKQRPKDFAKMNSYVKKELKEIKQAIGDIGFSHVIGTSGTLNNLGEMAFYLHHGPESLVGRDLTLEFADLERLYEQLQDSTPEERLEWKGLDPRRSDLILGGMGAARGIFKSLGIKQMRLCDPAIREGMVYRYIQRNRRKIRSEAEIPDIRRRSVLKLAHQCDYQREHAHQSAKLALQIFDRTQNVHQLSSLDRELLEYAALLHDIGYYIGYEKHHRHAFYLIRNVHLNGFSEEEIDMMALVARYHRKGDPKSSHPIYQALAKPVRRRVKWLAAILKLADGLDRSHFSLVENLNIRVYEHKIVFYLEVHSDAQYEIWEAEQKSKLFKRLTRRSLEFKAKTLRKKRTPRKREKVASLPKLAVRASPSSS